MATLCLLNENGIVVREWVVGNKAVTVGRGAAADIQIDDDGLSRRHFSIVRENGEYFLKDLSSRNGTFVDGDRAQSLPLGHNGSILAGRSTFRFVAKPATGPYDTVVIPAVAVEEFTASPSL